MFEPKWITLECGLICKYDGETNCIKLGLSGNMRMYELTMKDMETLMGMMYSSYSEGGKMMNAVIRRHSWEQMGG